MYLKYWTLILRPLMVCPKGLFPLNFSLKTLRPVSCCIDHTNGVLSL